MGDSPISPDGNYRWTGTEWEPIQTITEYSSEFRNPFQSEHSIVKVENNFQTSFERTYYDNQTINMDIFNQEPKVINWNLYVKMLCSLPFIGLLCILAYYSMMWLFVCFLPILGLMWISLFGAINIIDEYLSEEYSNHSKIIFMLLMIGWIGLTAYYLLFNDELIISILLTAAYVVPALLLHQGIILFDKKIEQLGFAKGMFSASLKIARIIFGVVVTVLMAWLPKAIA